MRVPVLLAIVSLALLFPMGALSARIGENLPDSGESIKDKAETVQNIVDDKLCPGMTTQECADYLKSKKGELPTSLPKDGSLIEKANQTLQEEINEAAKEALEQKVVDLPLPKGTSIEINDVSVTATSIEAETVIIVNGKHGGYAEIPVTLTKSSGTITATASAPKVNLPPGVPLTLSPNENIKASTATLVIQTSPTSAQPISSVTVAVNSPSAGTKEVKLSKVESGVEITSENVEVFTTATIKVVNQRLFVTTPTKTYSIYLPEDIPALDSQNITQAALSMQAGTPVYNVNATKISSFLWLIPVTYPVESALNANTGETISKSVPWWASLLGMG